MRATAQQLEVFGRLNYSEGPIHSVQRMNWLAPEDRQSGEAQKAVKATLRHRLLAAALLLFYVVQCAWFIRTQSLTYDEPVHVAEGLDAWRNGRFEQYNDHPPLARLLCSLPLIADKWQIEVRPLEVGFRVPRISPDPESLTWRARSMNVLLGIALALLLWTASSHVFSPAAANFALALFSFSPSLIAHFSLATTDGAVTLMIFASAWQLARWRLDPGWRRTAVLGAVLGMMLLTKYSAVPMFALSTCWVLALNQERVCFNPLGWNWKKALAMAGIALFVVWAGYFFHVSHLAIRGGRFTATFPNWQTQIDKPAATNANFSLLVPAGEYIEGFRDLVRHNRHGQAAFFLGQVSATGGWKAYYPVAMLLKTPTVVLVLTLFALLMAARSKLGIPTTMGLMMSFPVVYFGFAEFARFNIGERHVLPLYPFALLLTAALWQQARGKWSAVLIAMALLNAVDTVRVGPGYLSYFTPAVAPAQTYKLLSDSNLDWGQGLLAIRDYELGHPSERIWLSYFGSVDPGVYGIKAQALGDAEHPQGTVIIGATQLSGQFLAHPDAFRWVLKYPRVATLDRSMYVFRVDQPVP